MKYRWISWNNYKKFGPFTLYFPWWISGCSIDDDENSKYDTIVAAIPFEKAILAEQIVLNCFDDSGDKIYQESEYGDKEVWRFNELKEGSPFSERFPRAPWMWWCPESLPKEYLKQYFKSKKVDKITNV